jgi:hypothetical protein
VCFLRLWRFSFAACALRFSCASCASPALLLRFLCALLLRFFLPRSFDPSPAQALAKVPSKSPQPPNEFGAQGRSKSASSYLTKKCVHTESCKGSCAHSASFLGPKLAPTPPTSTSNPTKPSSAAARPGTTNNPPLIAGVDTASGCECDGCESPRCDKNTTTGRTTCGQPCKPNRTGSTSLRKWCGPCNSWRDKKNTKEKRKKRKVTK